MFRQVKSAIFWTLIYKFRKRLTIVALLLSIVLLSQWIYADVVEYLKLIERIEYLHLLLPIKWIVILSNIGIATYLILTIFKQDKQEKEDSKGKKEEKVEKQKIKNETKESSLNETNKDKRFSSREREFLTKKIRSEAEILRDKKK